MFQSHPEARTAELIAQPVEDELVIYDERSLQIHRLNAVSAAVWRACDGSRSVAGVLAAARREVGAALTRGEVERALDRLFRTGLFEDAPLKRRRAAPPSRRTGRQRRQAGSFAPLVTTIVAPTPIMSASGAACGSPCFTSSECASATDGCTTCSNELASARPGPDGRLRPMAIQPFCVNPSA